MNNAETQAQLLAQENETRVAQLEAQGPGPGALANAFDALKMLTYLENIALNMGIGDVAELDFQGRRSEMIDGIEAKMTELREAHEAAQRQARLAGGPIIVPPPGPNRQMRRHPNG